jgi:pyruvate dehydrogenase E2 component (dihydrolipoamide acetyltransferase)
MATEVKLPRLGRTMEEATIVACMVKPGGAVRKGDCLFEIETDKAALEIDSPVDGVVKEIFSEIGQTLPVGRTLLIIGDKNEKIPTELLESLKNNTSADQQNCSDKASPEIVADDLRQNLSVASLQTFENVKLGDSIPMSRPQKIASRKMLISKQQIPAFYLTAKADVTDLVNLREKMNESSTLKIPYNAFFIKAVAGAIESFPIMAGRLDGETICLPENCGIALAISMPPDLIAPVLKNPDKKNLTQIAQDIQALIEKTRDGKLTLTDLEEASITITNLGSFGIDSFIPIVIPGQCSILGIGKITDTCMPSDGNFVVRKLVSMTLSVDHRIANGAYAGRFLDLIRKNLEDTSNFT